MNDQQHQVVALLVRGGSVISYGVNQLRYVRGRSYFEGSLHAEVDLIRKSNPDDLRAGKIFIYRFNNSLDPAAREPKCGAPCLLCQHSLKEAGANKITYIDQAGELTTKRNRHMCKLSNHPHIITRQFVAAQKITSALRFNPQNYLAA